jgi:acetyl-CoA carboxylase biotin carboxylase subunit
MQAEAQAAVAALGYEGLGTVECLVDVERGEYVFLEMNTRLQVEHPITELTTGLDLVAEQLRVAAGDAPGFDPDRVATRGHALEFRICAEDPVKFLPSAGTITDWAMPVSDGVRVDAGYGTGDTVTPYYDSLLAKLCVWAPSREEAIDRAHEALRNCRVEGIRTNLPFFARLLQHDDFLSADYDTGVAAAVLDNLVPSGK